jgi:cell division protein FtsL
MNAAARHINQTTVFNGKLLDLRFSFTTWLQIVLLFTVFWSAVAVVYITDQYRFTCAEV